MRDYYKTAYGKKVILYIRLSVEDLERKDTNVAEFNNAITVYYEYSATVEVLKSMVNETKARGTMLLFSTIRFTVPAVKFG